jgi:photosystem II stability/assembly factor-like uncharacterized protein
MKKYFALILLLTASTLFSGCRGTGSSAPAPTNVQVVEGDSSVTISWDMAPGVEYWIFKAATTDLTPQSCYPLPECSIIISAASPRVVSGLTNGTTYSFTINGRIGGGKGGEGSPAISKVPRLAGAAWTAGTAQGTNNLYGIGFGSVFVAAGDIGALFSSSDGINWTTLSSAVTAKLNAVSYYAGTYLVAGAGGVILRSTDAAVWAQQTSGTLNDLYAVSNYGAAGYAATGAAGTILHSGDGITWTGSTPITANPLYGVTYANGIYVAVGAAGTLLSSVDAASWTPLTSNTANTLKGIAYAPPAVGTTGGGTFVAVGANGTVVRSADGGATWAAITSPISPTAVVSSVTYGRQFIAVADDGTIFTSTDGLAWTLAQTAAAPLYAITHGLFDYTAVGASGLNMHSM